MLHMEGKFQRRKIKMNKKTAVLSTAVILCLALGGVAYAHWMEIITIDGFVQTGTLELVPSLFSWDLEQNKPIAYWGAIDTCGDELGFELWNVYPCLEAWICMEIDNTGTIPAGLSEVRLEFLEYSEDAGATWDPFVEGVDFESTDWTQGINPTNGYITYQKHVYAGVGHIGDPDYHLARVRVELQPPVDHYPDAPPHCWVQIDPMMSVNGCVYMHFYEGTPESTQFRFQIQLEYWNWNEVV